jgi:hypothetical protein
MNNLFTVNEQKKRISIFFISNLQFFLRATSKPINTSKNYFNNFYS